MTSTRILKIIDILELRSNKSLLKVLIQIQIAILCFEVWEKYEFMWLWL